MCDRLARCLYGFGFLLLCLLVSPRHSWALELPDLAARTKPSVVQLVVINEAGAEVGSGTGFFIDGSRVVTNEHVIGGATKMIAKLTDGRELEVVGLLASDKRRDIAIIEVAGEALPKPLPLGSSKGLRQGDEIVVIGSPRGLAGTLSTGIVSALRGEGLDAGANLDRSASGWAIQITAAISPGSSGSPVMTPDGTVVAMAVGLIRGGGNLNFGVPIEVVKEMLAKLGADAKARPFDELPVGSGGGVGRNLLISMAFFGVLALAFTLPGIVKRRRRRRVG